jgi:hypothetical protein
MIPEVNDNPPGEVATSQRTTNFQWDCFKRKVMSEISVNMTGHHAP